MRYIDLTHTFTDAMPVYFGDPQTTLKQITTIEKHGYVDHQLTTVMHVGTHMDAPLHMIEGGEYMSDIPVGHFAGNGVVISAIGKKVIDKDVLGGVTISPGSVVLLHTGMDEHYGKPEYETTYPALTESFARMLVEQKVSMLGLDMLNPDTSQTYPIHKILLSSNVLIIENLTNLRALISVPSFEVFAFPVKLRAEAAPVRVVARVK